MRVTGTATALALCALAACSSSTEPSNHTTGDGLVVSVTTDSTSMVVGSYVGVTLSIQNTTSNAISRSYPPNSWGPLPIASNSDLLIDGFGGSFFGPFIIADEPHTLTVAPQATISARFFFLAQHAGTASVVGCVPKSDGALQPVVCASRTIVVKQS